MNKNVMALPIAAALVSLLASCLQPAAAQKPAPREAPQKAPAKAKQPTKQAAREAQATAPDGRVAWSELALQGTFPAKEVKDSILTPGVHEALVPQRPLGLTTQARHIPAENPITEFKASLGAQLFFDKRLSRNGTVSCASCHDPGYGWSDGRRVSIGIDGREGRRNTPSIANRVYGKSQWWDGRAQSLESLVFDALGEPHEMDFSAEEVAERLKENHGYRIQFHAEFGEIASPDTIAKALAAFMRTVLSGGAKNDYYEQALPYLESEPSGDDPARDKALAEYDANRMSDSALRGRELFFGKANCTSCHSGANFTDEDFHDLGIGRDAEVPDLGLFEVTGNDSDKGRFKTPTLRDVSLTAPYMHDGSLATLADVVAHYVAGAGELAPVPLNATEQADLVQFLDEALTGTFVSLEDVPRLP